MIVSGFRTRTGTVSLRLHRGAALAAVALLVWLVYVTGWPGWSLVYGTADAYILLALGLQIVAVATSPGPRRGLQLLTWKHAAFVVLATLAVSTIASYSVTLIVIAVISAVMALASSLAGGCWYCWPSRPGPFSPLLFSLLPGRCFFGSIPRWAP